MKGSITLDNEKYLRYMGEIQLTKYDLPADEKVNVVAKVIKEELPLINQIKAGMTEDKNEQNQFREPNNGTQKPRNFWIR